MQVVLKSLFSKVGQCFQPVHGSSAMHMPTDWKHCPTLLNCREKMV